MIDMTRRELLRSSAALSSGWLGIQTMTTAQTSPPQTLPLLKAKRLAPGDTIALINPSNAVYERAPYAVATESLQALGFKVREAPNLRARWGQFGGTDAQRAGDVNAMFADPSVQGLLALTGGSGANRILPLLDYELIRRNPKFLGGFSDVTALINAVHARTGLVTFHAPMGAGEWNDFSVSNWRGAVMNGEPMLLRNVQEKPTHWSANKTASPPFVAAWRVGRSWAATSLCSAPWRARATGRHSTVQSSFWKTPTSTSTALTACSAP